MEVSKFLKKRKSDKQGYRAALIRESEYLQHDVLFAELQRRTPWLTSMTVDPVVRQPVTVLLNVSAPYKKNFV